MAEVVRDPEALAEWEALSFRFSSEQLDRWMDGQPWILTAGVDYPKKWPWTTLKIRLRQNATARQGRLRIGRLDETHTQIQFTPKRVDPIVKMMVDTMRGRSDGMSPIEGEAPDA